MPYRGGPTIRLRRMGMELKRLREAAGLTLEEAGKHLGRSASSLSKIENGLVRLWRRELEQILDRYGFTDKDARDWLIALGAEGRKKGWWKQYKGIADPKMLDYVSLEAAATRVRTFEPGVIPGLLQTEEYTRAVMRGVPPTEKERDLEPFVAIRMARQRVLTSGNPPALHAIIGEAALRQVIGGSDVMADQLELVADLALAEGITIQVLPFSTGAHAGVDGSFTVLDVDPGLLVAVADHPLGCVYSDEERDVRCCTVRFDHLCAAALSADESRAFLERVTAEL